MRFYLRTSRRTGVSMPFWIALPVGACVLVAWLAILFYGLIAMALVFLVRLGMGFWRRHHAPPADSLAR